MAKRQAPGVALPGQYEGADTHISTDQTSGNEPVVETNPSSFPKYVFTKEGDEVKSILVSSQEELDALPNGWAETPAAFDKAEEPKAE